MNYTRILVSIFIMAGVTYLVRVLPMVLFKKKIQNRFIKSFLAYVPYAVLAAMTFPEILYATGNPVAGPVSVAALSSAVAGLLVALILAYKEKGLLLVALGATGAAFLLEQGLLLCGVS